MIIRVPAPAWPCQPQLAPLFSHSPVGMRAADIAVSSLKEGHIEVFALDSSGRRLRHP